MVERKRFVGITEKRLQNRRFRKTEEAILRAFFESDVHISARKMAQLAGVAYSTFYQHHHTVRDIISDYEKYILRIFAAEILKSNKKNVGVKEMYMQVLLFIIHHEKIFTMFVRANDVQVFMKLMEKMQPKLMRSRKLMLSEEVLEIYASEVVCIIWRWGRRGFLSDELEKVLRNIMFLTETAGRRLLPLAR